MAKKTDKIPGPEPLPKVGDAVQYIWPPEEQSRRDLAGKTLSAKVTVVYADLDSRVVDIDVDSGKGVVSVKSVPWQDEEKESGNTWSWPEAPAAK